MHNSINVTNRELLGFKEYLELYKSEQVGLVVCDSFAIPCLDSALYSKLPVIVTSTYRSYAGIWEIYFLFQPCLFIKFYAF